ncbi:MAG: DUF2946 family protein [Burkholderiaceae bacterium]|nr:DUF2946 family protein [Burkholderiaceae bacterium]
MDEIVQKALVKWPHVPHCYGWLGLDARGRWYMRDDAVQACGRFPQHKGSLLENDKLIAFIERNYEADGQGQWFFQNGPQRVYVELEAAPWVWRIQPDQSLRSHTGQVATATQCLVDETGHVYLVTDIGIGLVHTSDVPEIASTVERGDWVPAQVLAADLPERYGYVLSPERRSRCP